MLSKTIESPKATLLLVHGYAEHIGRYQHLYELFSNEGFNVYGYDHLGHGMSEGMRGYVKSFSELIDDLNEVIHHVKNKSTGPLYIIAHSMGAGIAISRGIKSGSDNSVEGYILSAPSAMVNPDISPLLQKICPIVASILPWIPVATTNDENLLSRDQSVFDDFMSDPLCYGGKVRAQTGNQILKMSKFITENMKDFSSPYLLLHGSADKLTPIKGSEIFHRENRAKDKSFVSYDGLYHELFHEPEKQDILNTCLEKLNSWTKNK